MTRHRFRRSASVILLPGILLLLALYVGKTHTASYYGASQLALVASAVLVVVPVLAGLAALEGDRVRRTRILALPGSRSPLQVAVGVLGPVGTVGLLALGLGLLIALPGASPPAIADLPLLAVAILIGAAHVSLAYAAGCVVPAVIAVPAAALLSWGWFAYPAAIEPFWIRHLNGMAVQCCAIDEAPSTRAALAGFFPAAGVLAAAVIRGFAPRDIGRTRARDVLAASLVAGGVVAGVAAAHPLGPDAVDQRPPSALHCAGQRQPICLWPEHRSLASVVERRAHRLTTQLQRAGVEAPGPVTEDPNAPNAAWPIVLSGSSLPTAIDGALLYGLLATPRRCAEDDTTGRAAEELRWAALLWLVRLVGAREQLLAPNVYDEDRAIVSGIERRAPEQQRAWFSAVRSALRHCDAKAV